MEETITIVLRVVSKRDAKILFDSFKNGTLFFGSYVNRIAPGDALQELEEMRMEPTVEVPEDLVDEREVDDGRR